MHSASSENYRIREYRVDDIPAQVALSNVEYPDEPGTVEEELHWEETYPAGNPRRRLAVEDTKGRFIGFAVSIHPFWKQAAGVYLFFALVDPSWRRRGIGRALLADLEEYSRSQGATRLWVTARESQSHSIAWLVASGFIQYGIRYESTLLLEEFDPGRWLDAFAKVGRGATR